MTDMETIRILTADEIWAADDIEEKTVEVPEWGGSVKIRALTLRQIANIAQRAMRKNAAGQDEMSREVSVVLTLQEGMIQPKLAPQDARRMAEKSATAVTRIVQAINALGMTPEAIDEADKSLWPEPDAPVPIHVGAGVAHVMGASDNGNVHS